LWHNTADGPTEFVEFVQVDLAGVATVASSASADATTFDNPLPAGQSAGRTAVDSEIQKYDQTDPISLSNAPGPSITHPTVGDYADLYSEAYVLDGGYPVLIWTSKGFVYELIGSTSSANGTNLLRVAQELDAVLPIQ
jgi:hypothetical protein